MQIVVVVDVVVVVVVESIKLLKNVGATLAELVSFYCN
jgi:hypothetical protein